MVTGITRMAIRQFEKVEKLNTKLEKESTILKDLVVQIPDSDMSEYLNKTGIIEKIEDAERDKFFRKRYSKMLKQKGMLNRFLQKVNQVRRY